MKNAAEILEKRLPEGWKARTLSSSGRLRIVAPDGRRSELAVLLRNRLAPREVVTLIREGEGLPDLVVAPYLSPSVRRRLAEARVGYVDETGNIRLSLTEPGLFIETAGANRDPDPKRRPSRSLAGAKAGRIVRTLCKHKDGWGVREIADATATSPGYVSRLLANLDCEALIERDKRGRVQDVDWRRLIERWAESAPLVSRGRSRYCIAPRGLNAVMAALQGANLQYSVTGSFATQRYASVAPARLLHTYVTSIETFSSEMSLKETDIGANVMLIEPKDASIIEGADIDEKGIRWAPLVQVAADLLTSQGRGPAEGEALLDWMADNEEAWRG